MRFLHTVFTIVTLLIVVFITACSGAASPVATTAAPTIAPPPTEISEPTLEATPLSETEPVEKEWEDFDANNFSDPINIDNQWFPLKPGTQLIYEGVTAEGGEEIPHRVVFTVTDLTKVIDGVRTIVVWDQDYKDDVLEETEIALFAQDDDGVVWHLGQYPEVYEDGELVEAPAWIHGIQEARAGISMKADPQLGDPSYSQGWGPAVNWTDRAQVDQVDQQTCVPVDCYEDVLVIAETSKDEPNAFQLKYYARSVGNVRVGWRGEDATKEELDLVKIVQLSPEELADVREQVFKLEENARKYSKEVYALTPPAE